MLYASLIFLNIKMSKTFNELADQSINQSTEATYLNPL